MESETYQLAEYRQPKNNVDMRKRKQKDVKLHNYKHVYPMSSEKLMVCHKQKKTNEDDDIEDTHRPAENKEKA